MPESSEVEQFKQQMTNKVAEEYFPELFDEIEGKLTQRIDAWLGENLPGQTVTYDFNMNFEIDFSPVTGEHELKVRSHKRKGKQVQGHTRTLTDQANFKLPDGSTITSDRIPEEILLNEIIYPVMQEYSEDDLAEAGSEES